MNKPKERPVIFSTQEVNAVLAGDKTQHRVPIKLRYGSPEFLGSRDCNKSDPKLWGWDNFEDSETRFLSNEPCSFGAIGDRLWVQEPTHTANSWDWFYDATHSLVECKDPYTPSDLYLPWDDDHQEYTGPIGAEHMPYWASRLLLEITDIRIERVRSIESDSAEAEGCFNFAGYERLKPRPLAAFITYWMAKHGDDAWWDNPWVWVIDFKIVENSEVQGG
jgi:hypothetical protein